MAKNLVDTTDLGPLFRGGEEFFIFIFLCILFRLMHFLSIVIHTTIHGETGNRTARWDRIFPPLARVQSRPPNRVEEMQYKRFHTNKQRPDEIQCTSR